MPNVDGKQFGYGPKGKKAAKAYAKKTGKKVSKKKNPGYYVESFAENETKMNWQDRIYGSLTETRASKKTQKAVKKAAAKKTSKGGRKVAPDGPRHGKKSFHSLQDPHNDQYNNRIGTPDE